MEQPTTKAGDKDFNPLKHYRTYSYHHVLVACDCSATAEKLATRNDIIFFTRQSQERHQVVALDKESSGNYVVVINGMTDADLVIQNAEWYTCTAARVSGGDKYSSLAVEGKMDIIEPKGVRFMNTIVQVCTDLKVDSTSIVWLLKTVFVGYRDDGQVPEVISDIAPMIFIIYDVQGTFTAAGGQYHVEFVGLSNGAARLPYISRIASGINVNLGKGSNTLVDALKNLETALNDTYDKYYNCIIKGIEKKIADGTLSLKTPPADLFSKVRYVIDPGPYKNSKRVYTVTDQPQRYKTSGDCKDGCMLSQGLGSTVEDAIHAVIDMSPEIKEDATLKDGKEDDMIYHYKIDLSGVESERPGGEKIVRYTLVKVPAPRNKQIAKALSVSTGAADVFTQVKDKTFPQQIKDNLIELDYLYTGLNTDILNFEIKMQYGLAYLISKTSLNKPTGQKDESQQVITLSSSTLVNNIKTPLYMGSTISTANTGNSNHPDSAGFNSSFSRFSSLEVAEAMVEIAGNPRLLHTSTGSASAVNENAQQFQAQELLKNWGTVPAVAKINIRMPRSEDDTGPLANNSFDYSEPFWYGGYFYVYGIKHMFNTGKFTQELQMIAIPSENAFDDQGKDTLISCVEEKTTPDTKAEDRKGADVIKDSKKTDVTTTTPGCKTKV